MTRRPHESPECTCAGCMEWDTPDALVERLGREIDREMAALSREMQLMKYGGKLDDHH